MNKPPTSKVAARKPREARVGKVGKHPKNGPATAIERSKQTGQKAAAAKTAPEQMHDTYNKTAPRVAAEKPYDLSRKGAAKTDQFAETRDAMPDSMRVLAQRNVTQMREHYRRSRDALQGMLEVWEKSFGAAGQDAVTLNRKIMDMADRNIKAGFDLAESLAGARNLVEVLELQAACWSKLFRELQTQAEEARELSTSLTAAVAERSRRK